MIGGGRDRLELAPLDPYGNIESDDPDFDNMVGCHTGSYMGLCILNPEPGFEYIWERKTVHDIMRAKMRGGIEISSEDTESVAINKMVGEAISIDSSNVFKDVIAFKYPVEALRAQREQEQAKAR